METEHGKWFSVIPSRALIYLKSKSAQDHNPVEVADLRKHAERMIEECGTRDLGFAVMDWEIVRSRCNYILRPSTR